MWVNESNRRDEKHQYFGQFEGKETKKVDGNSEKWSGTLWLHRATSGNKNE